AAAARVERARAGAGAGGDDAPGRAARLRHPAPPRPPLHPRPAHPGRRGQPLLRRLLRRESPAVNTAPHLTEPTPQGGLRFRILAALVSVAFLLLGARLWFLQVLRGDHYYRKSADNFVKEVVLPATRGQVLDQKRRILVDNRPSYNVYVTP